MNQTKFADPKFFYNFYSHHVSIGNVSMIANPSQ
jgi:hypothetical protein